MQPSPQGLLAAHALFVMQMTLTSKKINEPEGPVGGTHFYLNGLTNQLVLTKRQNAKTQNGLFSRP